MNKTSLTIATAVSLCLSMGLAQAQVHQPDEVVPLGNQAYADVQLFIQKGLVTNCPFPRPKILTRRDFAVEVMRVLDGSDTSSKSFHAVKHDPQLSDALIHLLREFQPECEEFGFDAAFYLAAFESRSDVITGAPTRPFPDVPHDDWAFRAVTRLHQAGILIGYPTGVQDHRKAAPLQYRIHLPKPYL